ncbi:MAG: hypothetical protein NT062_24510, partial [Proteobacteria bacterium]|nr:hypothetical protein [Pseudomonadota bacterium]
MRTALVAILAAVAVVAGCRELEVAADVGPPVEVARVARPAGCREVAPGASIQGAIDDPAVTAVCLAVGSYPGTLRLTRAVTVWGPTGAIIRSTTPGNTIELAGA